ncbi:hypothetical protein COCON_G00130550 [Conger conger]|uniref:Mucin-1 n=1 Tax=Conger conger TaxID=82655 RepID=A0A9Q1DDR2_CONCO|nr:hypothetical protein COCON_G00130550 [Conger conger]
MMFGISASVAQNPTPADTNPYFLSIRITNRIYNDSLEDQNSVDYRSLRAEVTQLLYNVYNCSSCSTADTYLGVSWMTFSKGSVIANCKVAFHTMYVNSDVVKNLFCNSAGAPGISKLKIDIDYTHVHTRDPDHGSSSSATSHTADGKDVTSKGLSVGTRDPNWAKTSAQLISAHPGTSSVSPTSAKTVHSGTEPPPVTEHARVETTTTSGAAEAAAGGGGVPGWGIAILVLACLILLLLIIILVLLLIRWCGKEPETGFLDSSAEPNVYNKPRPSGLPMYPPGNDSSPPYGKLYDDSSEQPKKNKTGRYVVNP